MLSRVSWALAQISCLLPHESQNGVVSALHEVGKHVEQRAGDAIWIRQIGYLHAAFFAQKSEWYFFGKIGRIYSLWKCCNVVKVEMHLCIIVCPRSYAISRKEICSLMISQLRQFLRATAGTAIARLSHRNSVRPSVRLPVCPSVTRVDQAKTVQARIIKSSPSAAPKTLVSGSVTLFQKFHRGHPNRGP